MFRYTPDPEAQAGNVGTKTSFSILIRGKEFFEDALHDQCVKIWDQCERQVKKLEELVAGGNCEARRACPEGERGVGGSSQNVDAQIAACQGLAFDELRNIHGTGSWAYPAAASRKEASKADGETTTEEVYYGQYGEGSGSRHAARIRDIGDWESLPGDLEDKFRSFKEATVPIMVIMLRDTIILILS
ncbi:hypothetical protein GGR55DRAFT_683712 [Xylaria sp. FL0064]|nr:hypothetical protein GGR55DRAFT_683712 [Xylaria sp. FL0064]